MGYEFLALNRLFSVTTDGFWAPLLDVEENRDEVIVRAELPGLKKEGIKLQVEGDLLILSGERKAEAESKEKEFTGWREFTGSFSGWSGFRPRWRAAVPWPPMRPAY